MTDSDSVLTLRPLERADADAFAIWAEDDLFCQHAGWTMGSPDAVRDFWAQQVQTPPADLVRLAVSSGESDLLGYIDLYGVESRERELGFLVGPSQRWGRGLGRRVADAGLAYGFDELLLDHIWAEAVAANTASVRILRALEMHETGRGSAESFLQTESYHLQFRLSRNEWGMSRSGR